MGRYLVVSSDGHAGPPATHYRDYLDPRYREAFDDHQDQMRRMIEASRGDRSREEKLREIIHAYRTLRAAHLV